jgi:hypothetical protein
MQTYKTIMVNTFVFIYFRKPILTDSNLTRNMKLFITLFLKFYSSKAKRKNAEKY